MIPNTKTTYTPGRVSPRRNAAYRAKKKRRRTHWLLLTLIALTFAVLWEELPLRERLAPGRGIREAVPVTGLHPTVAAKQEELIASARANGISILVTDGFRSIEEQDALYEQGRSASGQIVTNAQGGDSYHNYGLAVDFALINSKGEVIWDMEYDGNGNGIADWLEVVELAKQLGFSWGGDWTSFPDYPHLQMDFGYTIRDLKRGKRPPEDQAVMD